MTSATGAGTNYQVYLDVYRGAGTSSGNDIYLNNHNYSTFPNDINFTDNDETTCLDYWVEDSNSSWAGVWVEVQDDLSSTDTQIYLYYGKSGVNGWSNGPATFLDYDDFNDNSLDASWIVDVDSGAESVEETSQEIRFYHRANVYCHIEKAMTDDNIAARVKLKKPGDTEASWGNRLCVYFNQYDHAGVQLSDDASRPNTVRAVWVKDESFSGTFAGDDVYTPDAYMDVRVRLTDSAVYFDYSSDGLSWSNIDSTARPATWDTPDKIIIGHGLERSSTAYSSPDLDNSYTSPGSAFYTYADSYFVRKYTSPEPSASANNDETQIAGNSISQSSPSHGSVWHSGWSVDFEYNVKYYDAPKNACLRIFNSTDNSHIATIWNATALVSDTVTTYGAYTFSVEQDYKWDCIYCNTSDNSWKSGGNYTFTLDVPPRYQNVGSNGTTVPEGGALRLYGQGYDGIGLDRAWLATNETGSWKNYTGTSYDEAYLTGFTKSGSNPLKTTNGGFWMTSFYNDYDGRIYLLVQNDSAGSNTIECYSFSLSDYDTPAAWTNEGVVFTGSQAWEQWHVEAHSVIWYDNEWRMYYCGGQSGSSSYSIGYVTASETDPTSWTEYSGNPIYGYNNLTYRNGESIADSEAFLFNGSVWMAVRGYSGPRSGESWFTKSPDGTSGWVDCSADLEVPCPVWGTCFAVDEGLFSWIRGGRSPGKPLGGVATAHCSKDGETYYSYAGNPIITTGASGSWEETQLVQGSLVKPKDESYFIGGTGYYYYFGKDDAGTNRIGVATSTTLTTVGEPKSYNSPIDLHEVADAWTWSNFTWSNSSIPAGTTIQWRIYYKDTYGNVAATNIQSFTATGPSIESCASDGTKKDTFNPGETVHVNGIGYEASTTYPVYIVNDMTWTDSTAIPTAVVSTTVASNSSGHISPTEVWSSALPGEYDIIVDFNSNGIYDEGIDALDDLDVNGGGFFVIPEYVVGTILALVVCFAGFLAYRRFKTPYRRPL